MSIAMEETRIRIDVPQTTRVPILKDTVSRATIPADGTDQRGRRWGPAIRWIIGGAMLAEAGWLVAPAIVFRTSVRATITAPLVAVRVQQAGVVRGTPPVVGSSVIAGQPLFEMQTAMTDARPSERIRGEIESTRRTEAALRAQIAELDRLKADLSRHFSDYRDARIAQAEKQAAEQSARVDAAAARLMTAEHEHRLQKRLSSRGAASDIELARADSATVEARDELEVAREAAARQRLQLDAARRGIFVGEADGGQDRVASRQRCDEIEIQQAGLRARLGELDGRLEERQAQLASEERYLAGCRVSVVAPIGGVVWSSSLVAGGEVSPGEIALELIDPGRSSIEAVFRDADAERVRLGAPVKARLIGSSQVLTGRVVRLVDPRTIDPGTTGGAGPDFASTGTFRAIISLDQQPAGGDPTNRYHVGRPAVVWSYR